MTTSNPKLDFEPIGGGSTQSLANILGQFLRLNRSAQSGPITTTNAYVVIYSQAQAVPYMFVEGIFDLAATMAGGDTILIRVRKRLVNGGAWVQISEDTYNDAQVNAAIIKSIPDAYGVEVSVIQTAGTLQTFDAEFWEALS